MKKRLLAILSLAMLMAFMPLTATAQDTMADRKARAQEAREAAQERAESAKKSRDERVAEIKQEVEARRLSIKQDVCERRKDRLTTQLPKLSRGATSVKNAIDKVYDRVVDFYESGQLTVDNFDELVTDIEAAKAEAEASLEVVAGYTIELNCESEDLGGQLDEYRTAVQAAKEDLKSYRTALVALISSLRAEAAETQQEEDEAETETEETETETEETENE